MSDLIIDINAFLITHLPSSPVTVDYYPNVFCRYCLRSFDSICRLCTKPYFHVYDFCRCYGPTGYRHGESDHVYLKYAYVRTMKSYASQPTYCSVCQMYLFPVCAFC